VSCRLVMLQLPPSGSLCFDPFFSCHLIVAPRMRDPRCTNISVPCNRMFIEDLGDVFLSNCSGIRLVKPEYPCGEKNRALWCWTPSASPSFLSAPKVPHCLKISSHPIPSQQNNREGALANVNCFDHTARPRHSCIPICRRVHRSLLTAPRSFSFHSAHIPPSSAALHLVRFSLLGKTRLRVSNSVLPLAQVPMMRD
jgi:hypothetical protein